MKDQQEAAGELVELGTASRDTKGAMGYLVELTGLYMPALLSEE